MNELSAPNKPWCVYSGFTFLTHVEACDEVEANAKAESQFGLNKPLQIFPDSETVTIYAARNTFSLFQEYGGLSKAWTETYSRLEPISRSDLGALLDCMKLWVNKPDAVNTAELVGSNIGYVRGKIADLDLLLIEPRWVYSQWIEIELLGNDDSVNERDCAMADAYSDMLYTSTPED